MEFIYIMKLKEFSIENWFMRRYFNKDGRCKNINLFTPSTLKKISLSEVEIVHNFMLIVSITATHRQRVGAHPVFGSLTYVCTFALNSIFHE